LIIQGLKIYKKEVFRMKKITIEITKKEGIWTAKGTDKSGVTAFGNEPELALGRLILHFYMQDFKSLGIDIKIDKQ